MSEAERRASLEKLTESAQVLVTEASLPQNRASYKTGQKPTHMDQRAVFVRFSP
jgi:hypothetical protein